MSTFPRKVLIAGTVRNASDKVENTIEIIEKAFSSISEIKWLVIESDSTDQTIGILNHISSKKPNFNFISLGNLSVEHPRRSDRIATARNEYLKRFQTSDIYADCSHLVVADLDGVNDLLTQHGVDSSFQLGGKAIYTANQRGPYYDIWALRHDLWSPNDCWAELDFFKKWYRFPEYALQRSVLSRMIHIHEDEELIEVNSAFGGLAIYPRDSVQDLKYIGLSDDGKEICEHVRFSFEIRNKGFKIFINPKMINAKFTDFSIEKTKFKLVKRLIKYPGKIVARGIRK